MSLSNGHFFGGDYSRGWVGIKVCVCFKEIEKVCVGGERERERERDRERETDRQTDRQTERHREKQTERQRETHRERHIERDRDTE
jgi:hypothetical protein